MLEAAGSGRRAEGGVWRMRSEAGVGVGVRSRVRGRVSVSGAHSHAHSVSVIVLVRRVLVSVRASVRGRVITRLRAA